ncbi:hypothetical protein CANMA_002423 [Candida margitis]|uniref:uncharacterized protein n=1 Tax=Candida margitis TaxID=1775924 RepID=UPI0022269741|nr:uncharacterized protein CANMA_002423 [Candida margitis]KAI5968207.1 hypothetical protein CANMA_002423 [Candida margitis]
MKSRMVNSTRFLMPLKGINLLQRQAFYQVRHFGQAGRHSRQFDKANYDTLVRNAVHVSRNGINGTTTGGKRLPLRTILILIASSSTLSMLLYASIQYFRIRDELHQSTGSNIQKSIFLPLWFNPNVLWKKTLNYPEGLVYVDKGYHNYITTEMAQNNLNGTTKSDIDEYCNDLQQQNIKYAVLEKLSSNNKIRAIFGLPLNLTMNNSKFNIWVELIHPSASGIQIDFTQKSNGTEGGHNISFKWAIKPINWNSIKDDTLSPIGLGMARIGSNADTKIHEKSSGKIHEVHQVKDKVPLNPNRDYAVNFQSEYSITDKAGDKQGKIKYIGTIDFDHLLVNRGVKITNVELVYDDTSYKII